MSIDSAVQDYPPEWEMGTDLPGIRPLIAPARRVLAILVALDEEAPAAVIAAHADLSTAAALRHLQHLSRIGLAVVSKADQARYRAAPGPSLLRPAPLNTRGHAAAIAWRLGSVWEAARMLGGAVLPDGEQFLLDPDRPPYSPANQAEAIAWFAAERDGLARELEDASRWGEDQLAWRLGLLMLDVSCFTGPWDGWRRIYERAMAAARRVHNRSAQALADELAGKLELTYGDLAASRDHQHRALRMRTDDHDSLGVVRSLNALGLTFLRDRAWREAGELFEQVLETARNLGDEQFETFALLNLGAVHAASGEHQQAVVELESAIDRLRAAGRDAYIANAMQDLALAHREAGDLERADYVARSAIDAAVKVGIPMFLPGPLIEYARVQQQRGHLRVALALLHEAREIYAEIGDEVRNSRTQMEIEALAPSVEQVDASGPPTEVLSENDSTAS